VVSDGIRKFAPALAVIFENGVVWIFAPDAVLERETHLRQGIEDSEPSSEARVHVRLRLMRTTSNGRQIFAQACSASRRACDGAGAGGMKETSTSPAYLFEPPGMPPSAVSLCAATASLSLCRQQLRQGAPSYGDPARADLNLFENAASDEPVDRVERAFAVELGSGNTGHRKRRRLIILIDIGHRSSNPGCPAKAGSVR
jgi:hypothetical protein